MSSDDAILKVPGSVTAAAGFLAGTANCKIKSTKRRTADLAIVYSESPSVAAAVFTTNRIKAGPVKVSAEHLRAKDVRAVVLNSGNANAATGLAGIDHAKRMARATAAALKLRERQVLVCSTGRIGVTMPIERIEEGIPRAAKNLRASRGHAAARAIMTSDTVEKEVALHVTLPDGRAFTIGGMAKGAGMIDPNMATMLCVLTTDAPVEKPLLQRALAEAVEQSFNRITVDGDMSTNDTVILLANGRAFEGPLRNGHDGFAEFQRALNRVTLQLAKMIVADGEGVTRFVEVQVSGALTFQDARKAAEAVAKSSLVKCAWYGGDPNWGRIVDAVGYSTAAVREEMIDVYYNGLIAVKGGVVAGTPLAKIRHIVRGERFTVHIHLGLGVAKYTVYTTDLTPAYVNFNKGE